MDRMRQWTLLTVIAVLAILAGGYFLLVKPKSNEAAEVRAAAETRRLENVRLQAEIDRLNKQAQDLPRQQARLAAFASRIPSNPALPSLIRALTDAADAAGVELVSLAPAPPAPFAAAADGTAVSAAAPAAPATAAAPAAPTEPLFVIPVSMSIQGGFVQVQQFFSNIEDLQRTFQVSQFSIGQPAAPPPGEVARGLTVNVNGRVFMTSATPPVAVAVSPAPGPGASPTPAASPTAAGPQPTVSPTPAQ